MPLLVNVYNPFPYEGLLCAYLIQQKELEKALPHCWVYWRKTKNSLLLEDLATLAYERKNQKLLKQLAEFAKGVNSPVKDYILALYYYLEGDSRYVSHLKRFLEENEPPRDVLASLLSVVLNSQDPTLQWLFMYRFYQLEPSEEKLELLRRYLLSLEPDQLEDLKKTIDEFLRKGGDKFLYTSAVVVYSNLLKGGEESRYLPEAVEIAYKALKCCPKDPLFGVFAYTTLSVAWYSDVKIPEGDFYPYNLLRELSKPFVPLGEFDKLLQGVEKLPDLVRNLVIPDFLYKEITFGNIQLAEKILKVSLKRGIPLTPHWSERLVPYLLEKFSTHPSKLDRELFEEFAQTYPDAPETYLLKALISVKEGDLESAKRYLSKVRLEDFPSYLLYPIGYYTALKFYLFGGDIKKLPPPLAGFVLRVIYNIDPERAKRFIEEYFEACPKAEVFDDVLAAFKSQCLELPELVASIGVKCHPENPFLLNFLGYTYLLEGKNVDKALQMLEKAHKLDPDSPDILDSLGWAYFLKGDLQRAEKYIKEALQREPEEVVILYHYGEVLLKENKPCEAKKYFKKSLKGLLKLPSEPEKGILEKVKKALEEATEKCSKP